MNLDTPGRRVGHRIRMLRLERDLTQRELATRAGMARSYLARIEGGFNEPGLTTLENIAAALGVEIADLMATGTPLPATPQDRALYVLEQALGTAKGIPVPFVGIVPADTIRETAITDDGNIVYVPEEWLAGRDVKRIFAVVTSGDCLLALGVGSGSHVLLERVDHMPPQGSIVLIRLGDEYSLKVMRREAGKVVLRTADGTTVASLDPLKEEVDIIGVAFYAWRSLDGVLPPPPLRDVPGQQEGA